MNEPVQLRVHDDVELVARLAEARQQIVEQLRRRIVGQDQVIDLLLIALFANLVVDSFVNPYVEELYWKGHLMSRLPLTGVVQPLVAGVLFSAEHFWQPADFALVAIVQVALFWYAALD